jgi:hypothetical protein
MTPIGGTATSDPRRRPRPSPAGRWTATAPDRPWRQPPLAGGLCRTERGRGTAARTGPDRRPPGPPPGPRRAVRPPASLRRPARPAWAADYASAPPSHPGIDTERSAGGWPNSASLPIRSFTRRALGPAGHLDQSDALARPAESSEACEWLDVLGARHGARSL